MGMHIGLVAQPKRRRGGIHRAREQFEPSITFRRAREFCDREHREWYILSTTNGLISPHQVIGSDAPTLRALCVHERVAWAEKVAQQLQERIERSQETLTFVLYANQHYADLLRRAAPGVDLELPLAGLSLQERLRWYDERLRTHARVLRLDYAPVIPT